MRIAKGMKTIKDKRNKAKAKTGVKAGCHARSLPSTPNSEAKNDKFERGMTPRNRRVLSY